MRACSRCGRVKPISQFARKNDTRLESECKDCKSSTNRQRNSRERMQAREDALR